MRKFVFLSISVFLITIKCYSQYESIPLWPGNIPNSRVSDETEIAKKGDILWVTSVKKPELEVFLPAKQQSTGQAVVICPGGGYGGLAYDWEGTDIAKWLNSKGIAAFVLKYRMPQSESVVVSYDAPLQDAQRAIRLVRYNAKKWNINNNQIGVMGFSAGGHLASTLGTHFDDKFSFETDSIDALSARPDFMALIYPVITMKKPYTHNGSRNALLGKNADKKLVEHFSNELQVTKNTPPTFLLHTTDDKAVPVENSLMFYNALRENNVYSEMHIYPRGKHGFALAIGKGRLQQWTDLFYDWLQSLG